MVTLGDGSSLCAWHDIAWGAFLEDHEKTTGKHVRLGKYGNWHFRFREFLEWAEKDPKDRTFLPGQPLPAGGETCKRLMAV